MLHYLLNGLLGDLLRGLLGDLLRGLLGGLLGGKSGVGHALLQRWRREALAKATLWTFTDRSNGVLRVLGPLRL